MLRRCSWFAVLLFLTLTACGGGDSDASDDSAAASDSSNQSTSGEASGGSDSSSGDVPEACSFFTHDEIADAVGLAIQEEVEPEALPDGASSCTYRTPSSRVVIVTNPSDPDEFAEFIELFVPDAEEIPNVGDAAYFNGPNLLYVRVGDRGFSVRINDELGDRLRPAMLELAEAGAAKLQ